MKKFAIVSVLCLSASVASAQMGEPMAKFIEQWDGNADGQVTLDESREKRTAVFEMFDQSGDGVLDDAEWALMDEHVLMELGPGPGKGAGQGMGQGAGQGMGGKGPGMAIHQSLTPEFNDADANGSVTKDEFVAATKLLFPLIDQNADGVITTDDFGQ